MNGRRGLSALVLVASLACTSKESNYPFLPSTGGGGSVGTGMVTPSGDVVVTIVSPADGSSTTASTVINVSATVDDVPHAGATSADLIDTGSVKVVLTAKDGTAPVSSGQLVSTGGDVYAGTLSLGDLPSGSYTLTVSAKSSTGATGHFTIGLNVQGGPTLIVNAPVEGQAYPASLSVEILVDQGANPPAATLGGMPVTLSGPVSNGLYDVYTATVTFGPSSPPNTINPFPPLSGPQLLDVKEINGSASSEVQRTFVIDTTGPTIALTTPAPGQMTGGVVQISATITDEAGVLDSSVIAVIGDDNNSPLFNLQLKPQGSGVYSILFDTLSLTQCKPPPATGLCVVFPTISFRASDSVGNETSVGYGFAVDNIPPLADLDPPPMRQMRHTAFGYECSTLFDPLSVNRDLGDMPNDLCMVPQVFDLRARIEDDGNRANGIKVTPIAGIDPDNTNVYILTDTTLPLVVDSDGDGYCDEINPLLAPTIGPLTQSDQVLKIRLGGVTLGGSADFYTDDPSLPAFPLPAGAQCGKGSDTSPPKVLCTLDGFEQPTIAISYAGGAPAIWSVEPIDDARCLGNQLDAMANNIPDGQWICMAVGAADLAGSKGVSRPMRVYVKYDEAGGFCATPPAGAPAPPPCTGSYDPINKTAVVGSCQTLKFTGTDIYCAPGGC